MKKLSTTKFYNFSSSTIWLFDHLFIGHNCSNIVYEIYISLL
jgi:hypothetical protein